MLDFWGWVDLVSGSGCGETWAKVRRGATPRVEVVGGEAGRGKSVDGGGRRWLAFGIRLVRRRRPLVEVGARCVQRVQWLAGAT